MSNLADMAQFSGSMVRQRVAFYPSVTLILPAFQHTLNLNKDKRDDGAPDMKRHKLVAVRITSRSLLTILHASSNPSLSPLKPPPSGQGRAGSRAREPQGPSEPQPLSRAKKVGLETGRAAPGKLGPSLSLILGAVGGRRAFKSRQSWRVVEIVYQPLF